MNVSIIGLGYVGLTVSACLSDLGHKIIGVDIDTKKQNQYTEITNKLIIAPEKMFKNIQAGDTILVANSIYLDEIKKICKKNISKKLYFKTIDLNLKLKS